MGNTKYFPLLLFNIDNDSRFLQIFCSQLEGEDTIHEHIVLANAFHNF